MEKLALLGGKPVLKKELPKTNNIGAPEKRAVMKVLDSGILSDYVGRAGPFFLGGQKVKELEAVFKKDYGVKYAVSVSSATTGLHAAINALGIGPGDEVIVPPYTMTASVTAILMNGAIPVFADIEEDYFCIDPVSIEKNISSRTKAILVVNLFGLPANFDAIRKIARKHGLKILEDNAQSPKGMYKGKFAGTIGDVGVFSFNFHKTVHCGEGGVVVTKDKDIAFRAQLTRNHAENVLDDLKDNTPMIGNNYRLTEPLAAIAIKQQKKLDFLNTERIKLADHLTSRLSGIKGISPAKVREGCKHVYYVYPIKINEKEFGISRETFVKALEKEGFFVNTGYLKPIYLMPFLQKKQIFSHSKFPFEGKYFRDTVSYEKGACPVAERMFEKELIITSICRYPLKKKHIDLFVNAVQKIVENIDLLKEHERKK